MNITFTDVSDLEETGVNLKRANNLLSITLELFDDEMEITNYTRRYEAVVLSAMNLLEQEQKNIKEILNNLLSKMEGVA